MVKLVRLLEKLYYKTRKCKLDLEFLKLCVENNVIPKYIQFRIANRELWNSVACRKSLNELLQQEVINKKRRYKLLEKDLKSVKDKLLLSINLFDYNHVCNLFLVKNDKSLRSHQKIHSKKLLALTKVINNVGHNPKTVIFNFSKYKLTKQEESLISKGLQFSIPPTEIEFTDFMLPFELLYRGMKSEEVPSEYLKILINKLLDTATSSYAKIKSFRIKSNLSIDEAKALKNLTKQKDIIIQKTDKGNTVVILDKESYIEKMKELLSDTSKFEPLEIPPDKHLNFVIHSQDKIKNILKSLHDKKSLTDMLYKKISPVGCRPRILYGQAKVCKPVINNCPSFRPILDAINTPSYKLEILVPILSPLAINEYTVKDSFAFAKEIAKTVCNYE